MEQNVGKNWIRQIALVCFFVTGASGLIYQVTWNRLLGFVFGNTVFAISTVLTSFMAGLALGSYLAGRYADRISRSLRAYAVLGIGVGVYCIFIPLLIKLIGHIYIPIQRSFELSFYAASLVRFILCFVLLLIPSTLMGATTPIFSKFYVEQDERFGHGVGRIYSINTFGAFVGVVAAGFFMMEHLGVYNTIGVGVIGNIGVGIACLVMDRQSRRSRQNRPDQETSSAVSPASTMTLTVLMIGFGVSGFAALTYEVAWTRILLMIIGSSVYAFSIMLATFLLGLALGSFIFSVAAGRKTVNLLWFGAAELIIGLIVILTLPIFGKMPFYFVSLFERLGHNYVALEFGKFLLCFLVMIIPTILLGSLFPMVTQICTRNYAELGRKVGTVYSVNTLGNIGGSFASGFILIPHLGMQNTVIFAAILNVAVACAVFLADQTLKLKLRTVIAVASAVVAIACIFAIPSWDKKVITSGPSVYASTYAEDKGDDRRLSISGEGEDLVYYKEGIEATVTVRKRPRTGTTVLAISGKVDASNSGDMYTQMMVGHIPLLLSPNPENALVIGLGSGVTLGVAARYPLKKIDCVELIPAVEEASKFFIEENRNVLADPRVELTINDARNFLDVTLQKYDVIISEPSNLWLAGMANLFSLEFYQSCRERLAPEGILCQWVQTYRLSSDDLKIAINTFRTVFPHTSIWYTVLGDLIMVGSIDEMTIDYMELAKRYNLSNIKRDLMRLDIREPLALLSCYLLDEDGVARLVEGSHINTDVRPVLEFSAPRNMYEKTANSNHDMLLSFRAREFPEMTNFNEERVSRRASFWYHLGVVYDFRGLRNEARRKYEKAISVDASFAPAYVGLALNLHNAEKTPEAIENLKRAIDLDPSGADAYYNLAQIYDGQGLKDEAISNYRTSIKLNPRPGKYQQKLADLLMEYGDHSAAIKEYETALKNGGDRPQILRKIAEAYETMGNPGKAAEIRKAME
ncbi:fused MFS/spermidine synthase [Candidatus Poribacteria bacterium]